MRVGTARGLAGRCSADSLDAAGARKPRRIRVRRQAGARSFREQWRNRASGTKNKAGGMAAEETPDVSGATAAHAAAFTGDTDALIAMSKEDVALLRAKTDDGETPAYVPSPSDHK